MTKDITQEVEIKAHHVEAHFEPFKGTIRVFMYHENQAIAVLKSDGWDLMPNYSIVWNRHPTANDDSWFRILKET